MPRTRLAPSPTGALHLGNVRTFLVNWALARQQGWEIVLRIEDLDGPRVKAGAADEAIELLEWLGLDWDEGPCFQRADLTPYNAALQRLIADGAAYPCRCTRREIEAAQLSAPHGDQHELRYPGTCRPSDARPRTRGDAIPAYRLLVPEGVTAVDDQFAGRHEYDVAAATGDFLIATKEGLPSYQLAVVVDDARQQIDRVVRGDDLLSSAHRQQLLYERLGLAPRPQYWHIPLVVGPDGRRLAKRHGDTRIAHYRAQGTPAERIIALMARWCEIDDLERMTAAEFCERFQLGRLSTDAVIASAADDAWLLERSR